MINLTRYTRSFFINILFLSLLFSSCKTVDLVKRVQSNHAEVVQLKNGDKIVHFIPMHHVGKKEFYVDVRSLIEGFKHAGYVVYYESARTDSMDAVRADNYHRKFRKMMGAHIDSTGYAVHLHARGLFKNLVDQPPYSQLGVTDQDKRIDISRNDLVDIYESRFGKILLTDADSSIALGDDYPGHLKLPQRQFFEIIIDHRNLYLAKNIQNSADKKIVVVYGALHLDGTFEELKKMDKKWKKKYL